MCVCILVAQSYPTLCNPTNCSSSGSSVHGISPGKKTGGGSHSLLQGTFPTQGTNSGLQHCKQLLYHLCHWGAECVMEPLMHFNLPYTLVNLVKSHLKCAFLLKFSYVTPFWEDAGIWWPESLVKGKRVLGSLLGAFQEQLGRLWP